MAKKEYIVEQAHQVLTNGSWGSVDCEWELEYENKYFKTEREAMQYFNSISPNADTPRIRCYHVTYDKYGNIDEEEILAENW